MPEAKPLQIDPEYLKLGVDYVNKALAYYCSLLSGKDMNSALKVMSLLILYGLWFAYVLGTWFDGPMLLVLLWVSAFALRDGYIKNQKPADDPPPLDGLWNLQF